MIILYHSIGNFEDRGSRFDRRAPYPVGISPRSDLSGKSLFLLLASDEASIPGSKIRTWSERGELTDTAWAAIVPLLPSDGGRGGLRADHRKVINGTRYEKRAINYRAMVSSLS